MSEAQPRDYDTALAALKKHEQIHTARVLGDEPFSDADMAKARKEWRNKADLVNLYARREGKDPVNIPKPFAIGWSTMARY